MKEFYELFDHVFMHGSQIVIAGNSAPAMLEGLEDRIKTQLEGGIIYHVN